MRNGSTRLLFTPAVGVLSLLAGCQANTGKGDELELGHAAVQRREYAEAQSHLDAYLKKNPNGPRSAEAYYLKGHALQDARSDDMTEAQSRLQQARLAYIEALKVGTTDRGLEGLIRASLADVAFWQEDYKTAAEQGTTAYGQLEDANVRAMSLYRAGLSQQRLGRFDDGDKTLAVVAKDHPGTAAAQRAKQRMGVRGFTVRIPFNNATAANAAVAALTSQGFAIAPPPAGQTSVDVGPFSDYAQASAARGRLNTQYPKAAVVP
ncbi:MAG TPA: outer membrane protein assembly factor BamD [Tepidisphaeraceae bacterium]|jgi:tetratricopeptide (TPR) repeat protein